MSIGDNYFSPRQYQHNYKTGIKAHIYNYSLNGVSFYKALTNVIDYSYECICESEIRQSASLTLYVPPNDLTWYFRRESLSYEGYNTDTQSQESICWKPVMYRLIKTYDFSDGTKKEIDLGYFLVSDSDYSYDSTTSQLTLNLIGCSASYTAEYGGCVTTTRIGKFITKIHEDGTREIIDTTVPISVEIEGNTSIDSLLFKKFALNDGWMYINTNMEIPINNVIINGLELYQTLKPYEFDNGVSQSEIFTTILEDACQNYCYWIDEQLNLQINKKSPVNYGNISMYFRDYQLLIIDENISNSDSDYANYIEVYGDNGDNGICYGFWDWSMYDSGVIRKKTMDFSELQSNDECIMRAKWEVYKARYGKETFSVKLIDNYIPEFNYPSLIVGKNIEYKTVEGDSHTFTITGLSYSSNEWNMSLTMFRPYYYDGKTSTDNDSPTKQALMLSKPKISGYEILNNKIIRLYVTGEDIENAVVKMFEYPVFIGESVTTGRYEDKPCKIFDVPITHNGAWRFRTQLYNPCFEPSLMSDLFVVTVDDYNQYLTTNNNMIITDCSDNNITT